MNFQDFENILPKLQNISVSTGEYQVQNHKNQISGNLGKPPENL